MSDNLSSDDLMLIQLLSRRVRVLNKSKYSLPEYKHPFDSGMDVQANIDEKIEIGSGCSVTIGTGLYFSIPYGLEIQVRSRSGLAHKNQIAVLNSPGTVDSPYRGELRVILYNHGSTPFVVNPGDRIAQIVLCPVLICAWETVDNEESLSETTRGQGGFGSTGVSAVDISKPSANEIPTNIESIISKIGSQGPSGFAEPGDNYAI